MPTFAWLLGSFAVAGGFSLCWYRLRQLERTVLRLEDRSAYDHETGLRSGRLDTERHNRRTAARLQTLAATNLAAAKKRPQHRIYPPLLPPNDPPAVVASVTLPQATDWERTERIVLGDPVGVAHG